MILDTLLNSKVIPDFIFNLFFYSTSLLFVGWFISKLLKRKSAPLRSRIIVITLFVLLFLPIILVLVNTNDFGSNKLRIPFDLDNQLITLGGDNSETTTVKDGEQTGMKKSIPVNDDGKQARINTNPNPFLSSVTFRRTILIFGLIWILGFMFQMIRLLTEIISVISFRKGLIEIDDPKWERLMRDVQSHIPGITLPEIFITSLIESPISMGLIKPIIIIPNNLFKDLSEVEIKSILLHEISHISHKDHIIQFLQRIILSLNWWNPVAYRLARDNDILREEICDNHAIRGSGSKEYAKCLVDLAERTCLIALQPLSIGLSTPHISMNDRIRNILINGRRLDIYLKKPIGVLIIFTALIVPFIILNNVWAFSNTLNSERLVIFEETFRAPHLSMDENQIYIFDTFPASFGIHVYSRSDFSKIIRFAKKGEGPGEFMYNPWLTIFPNSLCIIDLGKEAFFSKSGDYLREKRVSIRSSKIQPVGNNYFSIDSRYNRQEIKVTFEFKLWDEESNFIKNLLSYSPKTGAYARKKDERYFLEALPRHAIYNSHIIVGDPREDFVFIFFDQTGKQIKEIRVDYKKRKVTSKLKTDMMSSLKKRIGADWEEYKLKTNIRFPKYIPPYKGFKVADNRIYAYEHPINNDRSNLYILDMEGNIIRKTSMISDDRGFFSNGNYYYLVDNEDTQKWELHMEKIE